MRKQIVTFNLVLMILLVLTQTTFAGDWGFANSGEVWGYHDGDESLTITLIAQHNNSVDVKISASVPEYRYSFFDERVTLYYNNDRDLVGEFRSRRGRYYPSFHADDESNLIIGVLDFQDIGGKSFRLYGPVEMKLLR